MSTSNIRNQKLTIISGDNKVLDENGRKQY